MGVASRSTAGGVIVLFPGAVEELEPLTPIRAWTVRAIQTGRLVQWQAVESVIVRSRDPVDGSCFNYLVSKGRKGPLFTTRREAEDYGRVEYRGLPKAPWLGALQDYECLGILEQLYPRSREALDRVHRYIEESELRRRALMTLLRVDSMIGPYLSVPLTARIIRIFSRLPIQVIEVYRTHYYAHVDGVGSWTTRSWLWKDIPEEAKQAARLARRIPVDDARAIVEASR